MVQAFYNISCTHCNGQEKNEQNGIGHDALQNEEKKSNCCDREEKKKKRYTDSLIRIYMGRNRVRETYISLIYFHDSVLFLYTSVITV